MFEGAEGSESVDVKPWSGPRGLKYLLAGPSREELLTSRHGHNPFTISSGSVTWVISISSHL